VLGVLAVLTHGAKIVLPAETFDAKAVLNAISGENCTALHGVPTMFEEILSLPRPEGWNCDALRTGIIAGAPVPVPLMRRLLSELGMSEFTSSYGQYSSYLTMISTEKDATGLTEASPTCFNAFTTDAVTTRLTTVGNLLPHLKAKIISPTDGTIIRRGSRGELCISGYSLQKGYWNNPEKTNEVMKRDENGILWLHTGDEASFTEYGGCVITGRFKDIIIRGGENVYPVEIEARLGEHSKVGRAIVVGIKHQKYGEVVGAFLQHVDVSVATRTNPSIDEIRDWTRKTLGRHKAPAHVFWFGEEGIPAEVPQTGSGKVKKPDLRVLAEKVLAERNKCGQTTKAKI
jgi:acyl-CoA synthetase (AMP-forming)/AMP-acid ligase II